MHHFLTLSTSSFIQKSSSHTENGKSQPQNFRSDPPQLNCSRIQMISQFLSADPALCCCMMLHKRVRGEQSWKSNQRRIALQQMRGGKRTKRGKQSEVATALSNCVHEGERRGTCPSHLLWSYFHCWSQIRRLPREK